MDLHESVTLLNGPQVSEDALGPEYVVAGRNNHPLIGVAGGSNSGFPGPVKEEGTQGLYREQRAGAC